jgi:hypothetical protein
MLTGLPVIDSTDWSRLLHAYGFATDTPAHLRALLTDDPEARRQALNHLWGAIIHQGTAWTATSKHCVDHDWGRLLVKAFPDGKGIVETEAQRRYLSALVEKAELWDPANGNASLKFMQAGLPYDRDRCAQLAGSA